MIRLILVCLLATARLNAQAPPAEYSAPRQALWAEVRAVNDSMEAAFNRGDLERVSRFYADDARMRGAHSAEIRGRAAITKYWLGIKNPVRWKLDVLEVGAHRDLAYQKGRSHLTSRDANGQERTYSSDFLVIWERQPDRALRILMDLWN